jgi:hypothetical protein
VAAAILAVAVTPVFLPAAAGPVSGPIGAGDAGQREPARPAGQDGGLDAGWLDRHQPAWHCDAALTRRFTPPLPPLGSYEACTTPEPLAAVPPAQWRMQPLHPWDAFAGASERDRALLVRLFRGRPAWVARGWSASAAAWAALTLISPYPDAALRTLVDGTLIIIHRVPRP